MGDVVEHLADTFDSNATLLKGSIIQDGMEVMGNLGKKRSPVDAGFQNRTIQRVL